MTFRRNFRNLSVSKVELHKRSRIDSFDEIFDSSCMHRMETNADMHVSTLNNDCHLKLLLGLGVGRGQKKSIYAIVVPNLLRKSIFCPIQLSLAFTGT